MSWFVFLNKNRDGLEGLIPFSLDPSFVNDIRDTSIIPVDNMVIWPENKEDLSPELQAKVEDLLENKHISMIGNSIESLIRARQDIMRSVKFLLVQAHEVMRCEDPIKGLLDRVMRDESYRTRVIGAQCTMLWPDTFDTLKALTKHNGNSYNWDDDTHEEEESEDEEFQSQYDTDLTEIGKAVTLLEKSTPEAFERLASRLKTATTTSRFANVAESVLARADTVAWESKYKNDFAKYGISPSTFFDAIDIIERILLKSRRRGLFKEGPIGLTCYWGATSQDNKDRVIAQVFRDAIHDEASVDYDVAHDLVDWAVRASASLPYLFKGFRADNGKLTPLIAEEAKRYESLDARLQTVNPYKGLDFKETLSEPLSKAELEEHKAFVEKEQSKLKDHKPGIFGLSSGGCNPGHDGR